MTTSRAEGARGGLLHGKGDAAGGTSSRFSEQAIQAQGSYNSVSAVSGTRRLNDARWLDPADYG
jgi:hypothetical protein